ncbi:MAG TPA: hypothetical protein PLV52_00710 [Candidatus Omnitrophota bacterium]|nr:hypothetical protein [Candidatus Omnitrophota bacterium]
MSNPPVLINMLTAVIAHHHKRATSIERKKHEGPDKKPQRVVVGVVVRYLRIVIKAIKPERGSTHSVTGPVGLLFMCMLAMADKAFPEDDEPDASRETSPLVIEESHRPSPPASSSTVAEMIEDFRARIRKKAPSIESKITDAQIKVLLKDERLSAKTVIKIVKGFSGWRSGQADIVVKVSAECRKYFGTRLIELMWDGLPAEKLVTVLDIDGYGFEFHLREPGVQDLLVKYAAMPFLAQSLSNAISEKRTGGGLPKEDILDPLRDSCRDVMALAQEIEDSKGPSSAGARAIKKKAETAYLALNMAVMKLKTFSGRTIEPPTISAGEILTSIRRGEYLAYFNIRAQYYMSLLAEQLEDSRYLSLTDDALVSMALHAYAGHDGMSLQNDLGTFGNIRNHIAASIRVTSEGIAPIDHDKVHTGLSDLLSNGSDYIKSNPDIRKELAELCAYYFAANQDILTGDIDFPVYINSEFHHRSLRGLDLLGHLASENKSVADLGSGLASLYFIRELQDPPRMVLIDINPFSIALVSKFIELCGKQDSFRMISADITRMPSLDTPLRAIAHAQITAVTHHLEDLDGFADFLNAILLEGGTFTINDICEELEDRDNQDLPERLIATLEAHGFSVSLDSDKTSYSRLAEGDLRRFVITGIKQSSSEPKRPEPLESETPGINPGLFGVLLMITLAGIIYYLGTPVAGIGLAMAGGLIPIVNNPRDDHIAPIEKSMTEYFMSGGQKRRVPFAKIVKSLSGEDEDADTGKEEASASVSQKRPIVDSIQHEMINMAPPVRQLPIHAALARKLFAKSLESVRRGIESPHFIDFIAGLFIMLCFSHFASAGADSLLGGIFVFAIAGGHMVEAGEESTPERPDWLPEERVFIREVVEAGSLRQWAVRRGLKYREVVYPYFNRHPELRAEVNLSRLPYWFPGNLSMTIEYRKEIFQKELNLAGSVPRWIKSQSRKLSQRTINKWLENHPEITVPDFAGQENFSKKIGNFNYTKIPAYIRYLESCGLEGIDGIEIRMEGDTAVIFARQVVDGDIVLVEANRLFLDEGGMPKGVKIDGGKTMSLLRALEKQGAPVKLFISQKRCSFGFSNVEYLMRSFLNHVGLEPGDVDVVKYVADADPDKRIEIRLRSGLFQYDGDLLTSIDLDSDGMPVGLAMPLKYRRNPAFSVLEHQRSRNKNIYGFNPIRKTTLPGQDDISVEGILYYGAESYIEYLGSTGLKNIAGITLEKGSNDRVDIYALINGSEGEEPGRVLTHSIVLDERGLPRSCPMRGIDRKSFSILGTLERQNNPIQIFMLAHGHYVVVNNVKYYGLGRYLDFKGVRFDEARIYKYSGVDAPENSIEARDASGDLVLKIRADKQGRPIGIETHNNTVEVVDVLRAQGYIGEDEYERYQSFRAAYMAEIRRRAAEKGNALRYPDSAGREKVLRPRKPRLSADERRLAALKSALPDEDKRLASLAEDELTANGLVTEATIRSLLNALGAGMISSLQVPGRWALYYLLSKWARAREAVSGVSIIGPRPEARLKYDSPEAVMEERRRRKSRGLKNTRSALVKYPITEGGDYGLYNAHLRYGIPLDRPERGSVVITPYRSQMLGRYPQTLSEEEAVEMWNRIRSGDDRARVQLIERLTPFVIRFLEERFNVDLAIANDRNNQMLSSGNMAIVAEIDSWDPASGKPLYQFLKDRIEAYVRDGAREAYAGRPYGARSLQEHFRSGKNEDFGTLEGLMSSGELSPKERLAWEEDVLSPDGMEVLRAEIAARDRRLLGERLLNAEDKERLIAELRNFFVDKNMRIELDKLGIKNFAIYAVGSMGRLGTAVKDDSDVNLLFASDAGIDRLEEALRLFRNMLGGYLDYHVNTSMPVLLIGKEGAYDEAVNHPSGFGSLLRTFNIGSAGNGLATIEAVSLSDEYMEDLFDEYDMEDDGYFSYGSDEDEDEEFLRRGDRRALMRFGTHISGRHYEIGPNAQIVFESREGMSSVFKDKVVGSFEVSQSGEEYSDFAVSYLENFLYKQSRKLYPGDYRDRDEPPGSSGSSSIIIKALVAAGIVIACAAVWVMMPELYPVYDIAGLKDISDVMPFFMAGAVVPASRSLPSWVPQGRTILERMKKLAEEVASFRSLSAFAKARGIHHYAIFSHG